MRAMEYKPEVAIIGAGPAGSAAAIHLKHKDVLLIDTAEFPRDKTCGDGPVSYTHLTLPTSDLV